MLVLHLRFSILHLRFSILHLRSSILDLLSSILLLTLLLTGCQPAGRYYSKSPTRSAESIKVPSVPKQNDEDLEADAAIVWQEPDPALLGPDVPIVFVPTSRAEWNELKEFWNPGWHRPLTAFASSALGIVAMQEAGWLTPTVRVKVPLGLDDPTPFIPVSNPPTLAKWQLGKDLFFDDRIFLQGGSDPTKLSCVSCHNPATGFTDAKLRSRLDTPTLINVAYQRHQFWNGRAQILEQVVQLGLEDEKAVVMRRFHAWPEVVQRLRGDPTYYHRFKTVFGAEPTLDAVGKAVATYLRTILVGNSVQDRAEQALRQSGGKTLGTADYEKVLDAAALQSLPWRNGPALTRSELAAELVKGYSLFHGKAGCATCHGGPNYSDDEFHNLGIEESSSPKLPGRERGRFATAPLGDKGLHLIGAYKTPTLRALPRTAPYFHNGSRILIDLDEVLFEVVVWHVDTVPPRRSFNPYLDPAIRQRGLKEDELRSLVVFLKALDGDPVPDVVLKPRK